MSNFKLGIKVAACSTVAGIKAGWKAADEEKPLKECLAICLMAMGKKSVELYQEHPHVILENIEKNLKVHYAFKKALDLSQQAFPNSRNIKTVLGRIESEIKIITAYRDAYVAEPDKGWVNAIHKVIYTDLMNLPDVFPNELH